MKALLPSKIEALIDALGLLALGGLFVRWLLTGRANRAGTLMAALSLLLFVLICLQFVRQWMRFWSGGEDRPQAPEKRLPLWQIAGASLLAGLLELGLILLARALMGDAGSLSERLRWFGELDTGNYMDSAEFPQKGGYPRQKQTAFCLEAQSLPDTVNRPEVGDITLNPGETYTQTTIYQFSIMQ